MNNDDSTKLVNLKVYSYQNVDEIRIYKKAILKNTKSDKKIEKSKWVNGVDIETGEIRTKESIMHSQQSSFNRTQQKIFELAKCNTWEYFFTFTFDPKKVDSKNYDECMRFLTKWLNNAKTKKAPNLQYLIVPEKHLKGGYHFHGILSNIGQLENELVLFKNDIYNLSSFKGGFTTVSKVADTKRVSTYITKYITKSLITVTSGRSRYLHSKNLQLPTVTEKFLTQKELDKIFKENVLKSTFVKSVNLDRIEQNITYIHLDKNKK